MPTKLLVFDFDGVIGDSFDLYFAAFLYAFSAEKLDIDHGALRSSLGKRMQDIISEQLPGKVADPEALIVRLRKHINQYLLSPAGRSKYRIKDGVESFLNMLDTQAPLPRFILSNSIVPYISAALATQGLDHRWTKIIGADSGYESKVHALASLAKEHGVLPEEILFVGDTVFDMQAGIDSGVKRVAIPGWHDIESLESTQPDFVIEELKEIIKIIG